MKNNLIKDNLRLVHYIVHKFGDLPKDVYEEYYQEGCYWLILAAERFDASLGFTFSTFASNYIYNGIRRYKRECGNDFNGLKVGRTSRDKISKLNRLAYVDNLDLENNEDLNLALDILDFSSLEVPKVTSLDIDIKGKDDSTSSLYELLPDSKEDFSNSILDYDLNTYLCYIRNKVSAKAYECIETMIKLYVETGDVNYSQLDLAEMFGTSQANISRIKSKGLKLWKEFFN